LSIRDALVEGGIPKGSNLATKIRRLATGSGDWEWRLGVATGDSDVCRFERRL